MPIKVYNKITNEEVFSYGVQNDKHGYPMFLIRLKNEWKWRSAKNYTDNPYENCDHKWEETGYVRRLSSGVGLKQLRCIKCGMTKGV